MRTGIKLDMNDYKSGKKKKMTDHEKIARLYKLADKINVQIGTERRHHDGNPRFLSKEP